MTIILDTTNGSLLTVARDVTGMGLKARMQDGLLVGDVCSTAETKADPVAVVAALNRRLKGRGKAQATWPSSPPVLGGVTAERAVRNNISRIRDLGVRIGNQLI